MIPCCCEWIANAKKDALLVVVYDTGFAMHELFRVRDFSAKSMNYALVSEADA
jgi:hypothetical protein